MCYAENRRFNVPIKAYFKGSGDKVMASMKKTYGAKKAKSVFYATANTQKSQKPKGEK
jgi:hypothetical protein